MTEGLWDYEGAEGYAAGSDLTGYRVEATDGHIGKVDKHTADVGAGYIVVDTGPWIFGREVLLPAGTVTRVDDAEKTVWVNRTQDEVKNVLGRGAPAVVAGLRPPARPGGGERRQEPALRLL
ncbi:PRC-barrel domain-containing protein [Kitasatospora phosalacinea]|uniref:PRC-barrel domain-containing protein n=1 Tax=Kitasatospora phosalacinea TaxID=2065 RepID=UPI000A5B770B|nr:PRC-barrel domain-containing protein [Kitasatospora phosalacinea]